MSGNCKRSIREQRYLLKSTPIIILIIAIISVPVCQCLWCCHSIAIAKSSSDECRLSARWPLTLKPSQPSVGWYRPHLLSQFIIIGISTIEVSVPNLAIARSCADLTVATPVTRFYITGKENISIALYSDSSLKRSGMARVNKGSHSFYLLPTRASIYGMSHISLYFPAAEHHRTLAGTHLPSRWGQEAELA